MRSMFLNFKIWLFILVLMAVVSIQAQEIRDTWAKTYGGYFWGNDWAVSMAKTSDDGYILTGRFHQGTNNNEIWTLKINSKGDTVWTRKYGKQWDDMGLFVKETLDGHYLVYGKFINMWSEESHIYDERRILLKYDTMGNLVWSDLSSGPGNFCSLSLDSSLIFAYIGGWTIVLTNKTDNDSILWQKSFEFPLHFSHLKIVPTNDDGYIMAGSLVFDYPHTKIALVKTNNYGDTLWTKDYCEGNAKCVRPTFDGGYIICGIDSNYDGIAIKVDASGDTVWSKIFPIYLGSLNDVKQTSDYGYIFVGDNNGDIYLIKTNTNGDIEWSRSIGGNSSDEGYCVEIANDGGYVILGRTLSFGSGEWDIFLIKTDEFGYTELPTSIRQTNINSKDFDSFEIYPNPMNYSSLIKYKLYSRSHIIISIFSLLGQKIYTLYDGVKNKGLHQIPISSDRLSTGIYFVQIKTKDFISHKKIIIVK